MGRKINRSSLADHHVHLEDMYRKMATCVLDGRFESLGLDISPAEREMAARDLRELSRRHGTRAREIKETI